jgi:tRNA-dihydrouridine synthase
MAELSHRALRELVESFGGCDEYFTEMISAGGLLAGGPFEKWYLDAGPRPEKTVYQLAGASVEHLAGAAALLDQRECAGIDINMGCSAPAIRKTGAGVAWMASPDRAGALMDRIRAVVRRRLSVKLRIGFTGDFEYLLRFCRRLEEAGTDLIILHPRTAGEKFRRLARWDYTAALGRELGIPVAGNGDIAGAEGLLRRAREALDPAAEAPREYCALSPFGAPDRGQFPAAACSVPGSPFRGGLMVGRGAARQPWIFAQARAAETGREYTAPSIEETGLRFLELLELYQPGEFFLSRARRFFGFFCANLAWGNYLLNLLNREKDPAGMARVWSAYFAEQRE